jgi:hypothetical protein
MSNLGKWDQWHAKLYEDESSGPRYGDGLTYLMAAAFLADVAEVEDWGCGTGAFKQFCRTKYIGIDGSRTPFADKTVDLANFRSKAAGIMLRHVLEHDYTWQTILQNAILSFRHKLFLCLFTPFADKTHEIAHNRAYGVDVPDLSFARSDIERHLTGLRWQLFEGLQTASQYGGEHVYLVWRTAPSRRVVAAAD